MFTTPASRSSVARARRYRVFVDWPLIVSTAACSAVRGILETTKVDGRVLRGRRLFSVLTIFEAKVTADLVNELAMGPAVPRLYAAPRQIECARAGTTA